MEAVLNEARACTLCAPSLPYGPKPLFQIHAQARILIAGQAPGRRAHESGIPFDDTSGERLRDWLGINRTTFYDPRSIAIVPMGFCYPGSGRSGDLPPRPECAPAWREALLEHLKEVSLTLVIGRYAIDYHLNASNSTVTESVQNWRQTWPQLIPLPHPSLRNNVWIKRNPWFESELLPALRHRVSKVLAQ